SGNVNTGLFNTGNMNNGLLWRGEYGGLYGFNYTMSIPDTAIPFDASISVPINIPISMSLGTVTLQGFTIPKYTAEINVLGTGSTEFISVGPVKFGNVTLALPSIDTVIGGPDIALSLAGGGGIGPIKIPVIDLGGAPGYGNSTTNPSSGFFNSGAGGSSGFGNVGAHNSGFLNLGTGGTGVSGYKNVGDLVSGVKNVGNTVSGWFNTSAVDLATAAHVSGFGNVGSNVSGMLSGFAISNLGLGNAGSFNVGNGNLGAYNFGSANIGGQNFGFANIGDLNVGIANHGNHNWGLAN
ncbi:pentapeptide repeat-containing protein, partial [Mycobacterium kiyosense]